MKMYLGKNVFDAARERVSYIFDEFSEVVVNMSGGKDSTVVYNLCLEEARRRGRLPLSVLFIDQEAEWQGTIDYIREIMYSKDVKPYWLQCQVDLFNAASHESDNWLHCWWPGEEWMRDKDPISIKENDFGTYRFKPMFLAVHKKLFGSDACFVGGLRSEEAPTRSAALTNYASYKHVTWAKRDDEKFFTFYPIYDWSYVDVWHSIAKNRWRYNKVYDGMYRLGVPITSMRVSNLNHETAVHALYYIQELEPATWNKLVTRLDGIGVIRNIKKQDNFMAQKELPFMFKDWEEYREYLLEHLVTDSAQRDAFAKKFRSMDAFLLGDKVIYDRYLKVCVASILANDYTFTKLHDYECSNADVGVYRKLRRGKMDKVVEALSHGGAVSKSAERLMKEVRDVR